MVSRMTRRRAAWTSAVMALLLLLSACGQQLVAPVNGAVPAATEANATPTSAPAATPPPPPGSVAPLTPAELARFKPNEMGQIPVLMYHVIGNAGGKWSRTPAEFRGDLDYLYEQGYYLTSMHQFVTGDLNVPAGKTPVVLTFDDGNESQFRYLIQADGSVVIDPDSAIGIIEAMYAKHPDFGRAAVFYVLPLLPFGDDDDKHHQRQFAKQKLEWLVANGYELGNHTVSHANLSTLTNEQIMAEIAGGENGLHGYVPNAPIETIALPFGMYPPHGDTTLLEGFTYKGRRYGYRAAMMVGAEPAPSPFDKRRDLIWTPRIRASPGQLDAWFGKYFQQRRDLRYISDGNPNTVTIPNHLPPELINQFNPASVGARKLIRYSLP